MSKNVLILMAMMVVLELAFAVSRSGLSTGSAGESGVAANQLEIVAGEQRHAFKIEMAVTPDERARGLMNRRNLGADAGMLFDYGKARYVSFWMKNTLIPLDMLFIDRRGVIVNLHQRAVPHSLAPISSAGRVRAPPSMLPARAPSRPLLGRWRWRWRRTVSASTRWRRHWSIPTSIKPPASATMPWPR